ncbi:MAG: hypothetical protein ACI4QI_01290 [Candidatus Coproplasma sp.]
MKIKTSKLIASITATAILASALCVGTYAITKSNDNFGFKGTYNLTAFAEESAKATEMVTDVAGTSIDVTDYMSIRSLDGVYTLFLSVIDNSDAAKVTDIKVGYKIGENYYNGKTVGLSNVAYSSLTVKTSETNSEIIYASDYTMTNATDNGTAQPMFILAEVATSVVGENTAELAVLKSYYKDFADESTSSDYFQIIGSTSSTSLTYDNIEYACALNLATSSISFNLTKPARLTLLLAGRDNKVGTICVDSTQYQVDTVGGIVTVDLAAGNHEILKGDYESLLYYINVDTVGLVNDGTSDGETDGAETPVAGTVVEYSVDGGSGVITLTSSYDDGVINMTAGDNSKYDSKSDASWSNTINGEVKTYTKALRANGDGLAAKVVLKAGQTVYVAFGANHSGKTGITFNGVTSDYDSVNSLYSALFSYTTTAENGETYDLNWTANMYIYAIIIVG